MRNVFDRTPGSQLFELICTALMIQIEWVWVITDQKWSQYAGSTGIHRIDALAVLLIGLLAVAAYVRWAVGFSKTTQEAKKEKRYRRIRDLAWAGMMAFGFSQLFL